MKSTDSFVDFNKQKNSTYPFPEIFTLICRRSSNLSSKQSVVRCDTGLSSITYLIMPPTLKKLMGHIAFGASVSAWVRHTFCTYRNFYTVKARVLKLYIWIPHKKIADLYFFSFLSYLPFWSYGPLKIFEKNLVSRISQKVFKLEA